MRKFLSSVLALLLIFGALPVTVAAEDGDVVQVTVANSIEEVAEFSSAADDPGFFAINVQNGALSDGSSFKEEFGDSYYHVVNYGDSAQVKTEKLEEYIENSDIYSTNGTTETKVNVYSPYSNRRISVLAPEQDQFEGFGATNAVFFNGKYLLSYETKEATAEAYEKLVGIYGSDKVHIDLPIALSVDDAGEETSVSVASATPDNWGYYYMGFDRQPETSAEVVVAVLDSGIYAEHNVFASRLVTGYNVLDNSTDTTDSVSHGTRVSGIIAENTPGNVKIFPVKIINSLTNGAIEDILLGIHYADKHGADIINLSLGGALKDSPEYFDYIDDQLKDVNAILVAASGNSNMNIDENLYFPAANSNTIAVGAINDNGGRYEKSSFGETLDFVAPGVSLTVPNTGGVDDKVRTSGTSFATPQISSMAAILKAEDRSRTNSDIYDIMADMSIDFGDEGKDIYFGHGVPEFADPDDERVNLADSYMIELRESTNSFPYTGYEVTPRVAVVPKSGGEELVEGQDYTVSYLNNISAGTAQVVVKGAGNYKGLISGDFIITGIDISDRMIVTGYEDGYEYTGGRYVPTVTVLLGNKKLTKGKEYAITCSNNMNVGTATCTVTGKGNYTGSTQFNFEIRPADITTATSLVGLKEEYQYTGEEIRPSFTIIHRLLQLTEGDEYQLKFKNNIKPGTATVTITGIGNFTGTIEKTFEITSDSDYRFDKNIENKSVTYNPQGINLIDSKLYNTEGQELVPGTDYTVFISKDGGQAVDATGKTSYLAVDTGIYTISYKGKGNYFDESLDVTVEIKSAPVALVTNDVAFDYPYEEVNAKVTDDDIGSQLRLSIAGNPLTYGLDYEITHEDNGVRVINVKFINNYSGIMSFTVNLAD